jgi:hypothetical protein
VLCVILLISLGAGLSCAPRADSEEVEAGRHRESGERQTQAQTAAKTTDSQVVNQDSNQPPYEDLITRARAHGRLRVIVQLKYVDWRPEGELPDDPAVERQRQKINQLQDKILKRLTVFDVRHVRKFKYTPQMTMEVDVEALKDLMKNPDVANISEDALTAPTF